MEETKMKKMVILNASPRKDKNTATLLKEAQRGAEAAGAEVQYINLVELNYKGCYSCMACKRKGNQCGGLCAIKDELRPVLEKIIEADALVVGSPIYWHNTTGMLRNFIERLFFPILSYNNADEYGTIKNLDKKLQVGLIYTMNVTPKYYELFNYHTILEPVRRQMEAFFGHCEQLNAYCTWQFYPDYAKYDASAVNLEEKQWYRDNQWPKDKEAAFAMGQRLIEKN
ncbi:MAG: flavodoxin family protein [Bacteroidales bacterium]|nr:flavodoxin family protein [Bacteroidales bacterium]